MAISIGTRDDRRVAFLDLVSERLDASYRLAEGLLGDRSAAEDATHDAIVRAWAAFDRLRDRTAFDSWFRRIVVNCCRDLQRRAQARPTVPLDAALPSAAPGRDLAVIWAERDGLTRALRALSREHREVVVLRYLADLPIEEVARSLGLPAGTVKSRLHHAITYLRAAYDAAARPSREDLR